MNEHYRTSAEPPRTSMLDLARRLLNELPGLLSDRVELLTLELRRAGNSLGMIIALALVAVILLLTAWFAFWIGFAGMLMHFGLAWGWALVIVLALNIGGAVFALLKAKALAPNLTLPATKRRLTLNGVLGKSSSPGATSSTETVPPREEPLPAQVRSNGQ